MTHEFVLPPNSRGHVAHFLSCNDDLVSLAVGGSADAGQLARIVGAHDHPVFRHAESSVLIVRV